MDRFLGKTGRKAIELINHLLNLMALSRRIFGLMLRPPAEGRVLVRRVILDQVYFTAVQALPVIIPFALIIGSMIIFQFAKLADQYEYNLGDTAVLLIVREIGPVITAILVILRSATAVTIETGYMKVFNEIEAIEMAGIDPVRIVCLPRLIGITSAIFFLFIVFDVLAILGGYAVVWLMTSISMGNFFQQIAKAMTASDITVGLVKAVFFGVVITVTCLFHGFSVRNQMTRIPVITARAAIECTFFCLVINVMISTLFYI
jgi:phospholipid/cholesterol/gamma-HCH transport system permease protein